MFGSTTRCCALHAPLDDHKMRGAAKAACAQHPAETAPQATRQHRPPAPVRSSAAAIATPLAGKQRSTTGQNGHLTAAAAASARRRHLTMPAHPGAHTKYKSLYPGNPAPPPVHALHPTRARHPRGSVRKHTCIPPTSPTPLSSSLPPTRRCLLAAATSSRLQQACCCNKPSVASQPSTPPAKP